MFKGLSGIKKAVKGGISAVAENTSSLAEQGGGQKKSLHTKCKIKYDCTKMQMIKRLSNIYK